MLGPFLKPAFDTNILFLPLQTRRLAGRVAPLAVWLLTRFITIIISIIWLVKSDQTSSFFTRNVPILVYRPGWRHHCQREVRAIRGLLRVFVIIEFCLLSIGVQPLPKSLSKSGNINAHRTTKDSWYPRHLIRKALDKFIYLSTTLAPTSKIWISSASSGNTVV